VGATAVVFNHVVPLADVAYVGRSGSGVFKNILCVCQLKSRIIGFLIVVVPVMLARRFERKSGFPVLELYSHLVST
jgi:hypothetical protein